MTPERLEEIKELNKVFQKAGPLAQAIDELLVEVETLKVTVSTLNHVVHSQEKKLNKKRIRWSDVKDCL